jgi:hypothetical protein
VATSCSPMSCPNGCCQNGVCRNGNSTQSCGRGGQVCSTCASGQVCRMGNCESPTVEVGTACISDAQCSSLGMAAYCKQFTSTFNASYQGGYCTLKCSNAPSQSSCPMNAFCLTVPNRGEDDNFCARRCGFGSQCRSPGYACYGVQGPSNTNVCWIFPAPGITTDAGTGGGSGGGGGGGGSIPDAGPRTLGAPCSSGAQCTGLAGPICIPDQVPGFGSTGYAGGYCTTSCGPTGFCPQSGMCITETFFGNTTSTCKTTCPAPLMGQSTCRAGYLCLPSPISSTFDGGFPAGWCGPPCNALLGQCSAGTSCGADGYCH